ncbi:hypothetical protein DFR70_1213 [Nocardia tenerifensis]|uniref:Uncharacterized protein n=1 Tax=Nocardia tenerifensis TaxID=228006 RepID=A0A318JMD6_9NOCA|nr:hypothetical protein [Nocardia tenerifensis]PXX55538.1 hypothetical protein DFR70_1213 [Nocardia tenerifensis]
MQATLFLLLVISLLIVVLSVLGGSSLRVRRRRIPNTPEAQPDRSSVWTSPVWNVVGVIAGVVGTIASIIGLLK